MRDLFRGFYPPTEAELTELWDEGLIVLDTNVLLNLFRYSHTTRDELLALLTSVRDRLWIPHQVALEFHQRRWSVVGSQEAGFDAVEAALKEAQQTVQDAVDKLHRGTSADTADLTIKLNESMGRFRTHLSGHKERAANYLATFNGVSELFEGHVGTEYTPDKLKAVYAEGEERFAKKIPPGFKDEDKASDRRFGDLVLWKQILDKGAESQRAVIFVTEDAKDDWWERTSGKARGPRPELVEEYLRVASKRVALYNVGSFLHAATARGIKVSPEAVEEAVETREAVEAAARELNRARTDALLRAAGPQPVSDLKQTYDVEATVRLARALLADADHLDPNVAASLNRILEGTPYGRSDYDLTSNPRVGWGDAPNEVRAREALLRLRAERQRQLRDRGAGPAGEVKGDAEASRDGDAAE